MKNYYFAYNSDMLQSALEYRVGPVKSRGVATLPEKWTLDYSKLVSRKNIKDETGKIIQHGYANIRQLGDQDRQIFGVLYSLTEDQWKKLDNCMGNPFHYRRRPVDIFHNDKFKLAQTYVARVPTEGLKPNGVYLELMVRGAINNQLPKEYITYLMSCGHT